MTNSNRFIQFELWKDCSIGCKFCCNRGQPKIDKKESINYIIDILNSEEIENYNEVGFIGGEFFNGELEEVKSEFYNLFKKVSGLNFDRVYITAALIYDINKSLVPFFNYLNDLNIINKIMICSSFDTIYRFKSYEEVDLWKYNMKLLKKLYPEITLHTEIILTEMFMETVINNKFNINNFKLEFQTGVDFIEPSSGLYFRDKYDCDSHLPGFFPKKNTFIKFLRKIYDDNSISLDTLLSMELRSNTLYFIENENRRKVENRRDGDGRCELSDKTKKYDIGFIDSDQPMRDVVEKFNLIVGDN